MDEDPLEGQREMRVQVRGCGEKPDSVRVEVWERSLLVPYCSHNGNGSMPTKTIYR